jgi:hypothetical protein
MRLQKAKGEGLAWCWAASLATVFDAHGYKIGQDEIVAKAFPSGFDPSSSIDQVLSAMSLDWNLADGRELFVDAELIAGDPGLFSDPDIVWEAAQEMVDRNALVSDVLGYPTLIAEISFSSQEEGQGRISSLTVLDPWPGKASTRTLGRDEALRAKALAKIVVGEYS